MTQPLLPRRAVLFGATVASLAAAGAAEAEATPVTAKGTVYEEAGAGRRGVPDILVSNGLDVVATGADGSWSLPLAAGESVFVIKPSFWTTPVDPETQLARFAYLYSPGGTPASLRTRFAGVSPTGPLPASIDFVLRRQDEPTPFDALLMTDPQPESIAELGYVRDDVVAQMGEVPAAFAIAHGDLMFDDLAFYDRFNRMMGTAGIPWHACPGNHDMNYEAPDDALSARRGSACSAPAITRSSMAVPRSSCWTTWNISAPTRRGRLAPATTAAVSARASSLSCATFWRTCPATAWWCSPTTSRSTRCWRASRPTPTPTRPTCWPPSPRIRTASASAATRTPTSTGTWARTASRLQLRTPDRK